MSLSYEKLHSHSWLERELKMKNCYVLVDERYEDVVSDGELDKFKPFVYEGVKYIKVPTIVFVKHNGVFKNFRN